MIYALLRNGDIITKCEDDHDIQDMWSILADIGCNCDSELIDTMTYKHSKIDQDMLAIFIIRSEMRGFWWGDV